VYRGAWSIGGMTFAAHVQRPAMPVIGYLNSGSADAITTAFVHFARAYIYVLRRDGLRVPHAASDDDKSRKNFHLPEVTL
jgi:hypothetical protein